MKRTLKVYLLSACLPAMIMAEEKPAEETAVKLREGASKLADQQDNLAADVQQLTVEQTIPNVIKLLEEVEQIMDESTDKLAEADTGGATLAAQTEVIEKIHAAAQEKQKQEGSGKSGSAMMDMMERMMGKKPDGEGEGKGDKPSDKGGQGQTGLSDTANEGVTGQGDGKTVARRVPKASGSAGRVLPEEFRNALDAYNRGAQQKAK
jgi:TolA-binding protein